MSLVQKVSNVLDGRKEAGVKTPLSDNKSLKKYVDKGTDEQEDVKESLFTIRGKNLDKSEGKSKGSTRLFNLDGIFLNLQLIQNSIKLFEK